MWEKYTVNELKVFLKERDLPVSGIKKILIFRLEEYEKNKNINNNNNDINNNNINNTDINNNNNNINNNNINNNNYDFYNKYKVDKLKDILRDKGLSCTGVKKVLIERILESNKNNNLNVSNINIDMNIIDLYKNIDTIDIDVNININIFEPNDLSLQEWMFNIKNLYVGKANVAMINDNPFPPYESLWNNPHNSIILYKKYIIQKLAKGNLNIEILFNKTLGCTCKDDKCHSIELIKLAKLWKYYNSNNDNKLDHYQFFSIIYKYIT